MQHCRAATEQDIPAIMEILAGARAYLKEQGVDQWQNKTPYPSREMVEGDISRGESFLWEDDEGHILATAACSLREEPTYREIFDGAWTIGGEYAVIHRTASAAAHRRNGAMSGLFAALFDYIRAQGVGTARIDTHEDNVPMRTFLEKQGFSRSGIIFLKDGARRVAYERALFPVLSAKRSCQTLSSCGTL